MQLGRGVKLNISESIWNKLFGGKYSHLGMMYILKFLNKKKQLFWILKLDLNS